MQVLTAEGLHTIVVYMATQHRSRILLAFFFSNTDWGNVKKVAAGDVYSTETVVNILRKKKRLIYQWSSVAEGHQ